MANETAAPKAAYVYMLRCENGALYTGWTPDPAARLRKHKTGGGAKFTRAFAPSGFAYLEQLPDKSAALKREAALKKLPKAKKEALCTAWQQQSRPRLTVATMADADDLLALQSWYVQNSTATFQLAPYTPEEFAAWLADTLAGAPMILARDAAGKLLGYACAHQYRSKEAFQWAAETTIYCAPDARSRGVGTALYHALLEALTLHGWWTAYGLLTDPNPASEAFHQKFGFVCEGRSPRCGYKHGQWLGLSTWALPLQTGRGVPQPKGPVPTAQQLAPILEKYSGLLG